MGYTSVSHRPPLFSLHGLAEMLLSTLLLLAAPFAALADKDSDFYYSGFNNPNVKKDMYWKDAYNVLEDLDQFSALYITYENCVHSLYPTNPGSGEDEHNEGYDYWYRNSYPQFLANGAYSLYGILSNGNNGAQGNTTCHRGTYINSFFTNRGVETLAYPFGIVDYNGDIPTSQCERGEDGAQESYGLGCYNGQFVYGQFDGGSCGGNIQSVSDYLETFNANMEALQCVQIYNQSGSLSMGDDGYGDDTYADAAGDDAYANDGYVAAYGDDYVAYNDDGNDAYNDDGNQEDGEGGNYNQYADSDPLDILAYSEACSIQLYGSACPDPFGIKKGYDSTLRRALKVLPSSTYGDGGKQTMQIASLVLLALGVVLLAAAFIVRMTFPKRSIYHKEDALIASKPSRNPRNTIHSASTRGRKWNDTEAHMTTFPSVSVVDSPSKDDSYIQLNKDSPTEGDEPASIPSPEKPVVTPLEPAVVKQFQRTTAPFPENSYNPVKRGHSLKRSYQDFAEGEDDSPDEPAPIPTSEKPAVAPSQPAAFKPAVPPSPERLVAALRTIKKKQTGHLV